jgi:hypothetical protein
MTCTADLTGENADGNQEIVLLDLVSFRAVTTSSRVTNFSSSISADGRTVSFISDANYTGRNVDGSYEIFLWRDGLDGAPPTLTQITNRSDDAFPQQQQLSGDGSRVLFADAPGGRATLFLYDDALRATTVIATAPLGIHMQVYGQLSRDGLVAVFVQTTGLGRDFRAVLYTQPIGAATVQLAGPSEYTSFATNSDGTRIASTLNGPELFTPLGPVPLRGVPPDAGAFALDAAGRFLSFLSREDITRHNPDGATQVFVADLPFPACPSDCNNDGAITDDDIEILLHFLFDPGLPCRTITQPGAADVVRAVMEINVRQCAADAA